MELRPADAGLWTFFRGRGFFHNFDTSFLYNQHLFFHSNLALLFSRGREKEKRYGWWRRAGGRKRE